jgi:HK97 family phage prohead protease
VALDTRPPTGVREEAARGLAWREEFGRGGTPVGVARARDLKNGVAVSEETIGRMVSYFARHEVDKEGEGWSPGQDGYPSAGRIAWALWGGDPGRSWANRIMEKIKMEEKDDEVVSVQRDGLTRSAPFEFSLVRDKSGDGLTLHGYAAVFDSPTHINNHEGNFTESISRGAFKKTIRDGRPVLQFDHGKHPMIGSLPIGKIEALKEDATGLHVTARLHSGSFFDPVREAIASGAIDGMSFRFSVVKEDWTPAERKNLPHRTIQEVRLFELGPVVFPAYAATSVGVRDNDTDSSPEEDFADGANDDESAVSEETEPREHSDSNLTISRRRRLALEEYGVTR